MSQQDQTVFNGRYELHRRLGRGGMAEVHLARDQLLDRPVAVKVLFPEFATDRSFVERFRREAQSAANLNHPNIVGVYDWGESGGTYFIVMEYVAGRSLAEILGTEGPLHPDRVADVGADVAAALAFAHRNGVVHRDVKPGNVLVTEAGQVKVADFGIARAITAGAEENLTQAGTVMGTATYFSPEQARGESVDPRSDLYSLGCVLYELAVGRPPFTGESPVAIAYKHVQETPTPPRHLNIETPPALEAIILKCLAKNPVNRYPSGEDLRADLRRFREGRGILAEPVMAPPLDPAATGVMAATGATASYGPGTAVQEPYYDEDEDEEEERKGSKAFIVVLVLLLLALAGLLVLFARVLGVGDEQEAVEQVEVPRLIGTDVEDARQVLTALGLETETQFEENDDFDQNIVFGQDPEHGERVDVGSAVILLVSRGAEAVEVPDVRGQQYDDARRLLEARGFEVAAPQTVPDEDSPEGEVIDQDPPPDQEAPSGSLVTLTVSSGPAPRVVPDVAGLSPGDAENQLRAAGFVNIGRANEASGTVEQGLVIRTDPAIGTEQPRSATITIVVSTGPQQVTVPSVEGLSETNAINQLEAAGFSVEVSDEPVTDLQQDGRVLSQSPSGNSQADRGSTVRIVVGRFVEPATTTTTTTIAEENE